ncbi:Conserved_hypothetical protein [Hexamita inflata]|uniref:Uncharacterized protein n=1 Tax=Hexamita inflata TaxID=28002 RepID=A0AA86UUC3_9EUKA|nr:Conserved hypothetical protein [Hexamita inflata]
MSIPYGKINPQERKQKSLELLAKHASQWEQQVQQFASKRPVQQQKRSVMTQDGEFREKMRERALNEANNKQQQAINWERSLRSDEKLVEYKLGHLNPIICMRPIESEGIAIKKIINMRKYVPIDEKLPQQFKDMIKLKSLAQSYEQQEPEEQLEAPVTERQMNSQHDANNDANIDYIRPEPMHLLEPICIATKFTQPRLRINQVTFMASNENVAVCKIENIGDCVVEIQMRHREQQIEPPKQKIKDVEKEQYLNNQPIQQNQNKLTSKSIIQSQANSPMSKTSSTRKTFTFAQKTQSTEIKTLINESGARDDQQQKMLEKSTTPANLRILSDRYVNVDSMKMIVGMRHNRVQVACNQVEEIKFVMPTANNKAGIILQEYELVITPSCQIIFESQEDQVSQSQNVLHRDKQTIVYVRCYGINSQCLQLYKQQISQEKQGRAFVQKFAHMSTCESLVYEFAFQSIDISENAKIKAAEDKNRKKQIMNRVEDRVVKCYQNDVVKAKWLKNKQSSKEFLYDLLAKVDGFQIKNDNLYNTQEQIQDFSSKIYQYKIQENSEEIGHFRLNFIEFSKQSLYKLLTSTMNNELLGSHYLFENIEIFNKYAQNLIKIVRKRLIGFITDDQCKENLVVNQSHEAEEWINTYAICTQPAQIAMFCQFSKHKLVQDLMNQILNIALPYVLKQVKVDKNVEQMCIDADGKIVSKVRPGFTEHFTQLVYLAACCAQSEPVMSIVDRADFEQRHGFYYNLLKLRMLLEDDSFECSVKFNSLFPLPQPACFQLSEADLKQIMSQIIKKEALSERIIQLVNNDISLLRKRESQYSKTQQHRVFFELILSDVYDINDISLFQYSFSTHPDYIAQYYEELFTNSSNIQNMRMELTTEIQAQTELELKNTKTQKIRVPSANSKNKLGKTSLSQENMSFTNRIEKYETVSDSYRAQMKNKVQKSPQTTKGTQVNVQQQVQVVTELKNRKFCDFATQSELHALLQQMNIQTTMEVDKLSLAEVLVDAAMLCIQLSAFPAHPVFDQNVQGTYKGNYQGTERTKVVTQLKQALLAKQKLTEPVKGQKLPKGKETNTDQQANIAIDQILDKISTVEFVPVKELLNTTKFIRTVGQQQKEEQPEFVLYDTKEEPIVFSLPKNKQTRITENKLSAFKLGLSQNASTDSVRSVRKDSQLQNIATSRVRLEQILEEEQQVVEETYDLQHEMRLKIFRQEFDVFLDAILTDQSIQAVDQHLEALQAFEDEQMTFDKIQLVRMGQLKPDDIGMLDSEIEAAIQPTRPTPDIIYQNQIQKVQEMQSKLVQQTAILFEEDYQEGAVQLLHQSLVKTLDKLEQCAIQHYRSQFEDYDDVAVAVQNILKPKRDLLKNKDIEGCIEVAKMFNIQLQLPQQQNEYLKSLSIEVSNQQKAQFQNGYNFNKIRNFINNNPEKHKQYASQYSFLITSRGIFDAQSDYKLNEDLDFIDIDAKILEPQMKGLGGKKKTKPESAKNTRVPAVQQQQQPEEPKEEIADEDLPKYLRQVELTTVARRDVWSYLFNNAIDRSTQWFKSVDKLEGLLERAANYIGRGIMTFVQAE